MLITILIKIRVPCFFSVKSETGKMEAKIVKLRSEKSPPPPTYFVWKRNSRIMKRNENENEAK